MLRRYHIKAINLINGKTIKLSVTGFSADGAVLKLASIMPNIQVLEVVAEATYPA